MRDKQKLTNTLVLPDASTGRDVKVKLKTGFLGTVRKKEDGLLSVTIESFRTRVLVRERAEGSIELRASWIPGLLGRKSDRLSTETTHWPDAIKKAVTALTLELERQIRAGEDTRQKGAPLTLHGAIEEIRSRGLVPGGADTDTARKTRAQYDRALDLAQAILHEDPILPLHQAHVDRFIAVRTGAVTAGGAPLYRWPSSVGHREDPKPVKPRTAEKGLQDLRTVLRKLIGVRDAQGQLFLEHDPMAGLNIDHHPAMVMPTAGANRHRTVLASIPEAEERMAAEGLLVKEKRKKSDGTRSKRSYSKLLRVIPGQMTCLLIHQVLHPTRPRSWLHVRMSDVALSRNELVALHQSLIIHEGTWAPPPDVANTWVHGAIAYRKRWSKLKSERLIPLTEAFHHHLAAYLHQRSLMLSEEGKESPWLYPSPRDLTRPMTYSDARLLLLKAEEVAREKLTEEGLNPDEFVPLIKGARWYAYRRAWAANREESGWGNNSNADYVGDWSVQKGRTRQRIYAGLSPRLILAVASGLTYQEATHEAPDSAAIKAAAGVEPIDLAALARGRTAMPPGLPGRPPAHDGMAPEPGERPPAAEGRRVSSTFGSAVPKPVPK